MKILKTAISASFIVVISLLFIQCHSKKNSSDLFVGQWHEVPHAKKDWVDIDMKDAMTLTLNQDKTFSFVKPPTRTSLSGTWSVGEIDTTTFLALKYNYHIQREMDYDSYGGSDFYQYYFFKVNKAEKGKLYLVDMSCKYEDERIKEHLFKPQE